MMKGITPIIAIIVLLLITVALAGAAWSYLQNYMAGLTNKNIEVRDYFCLSGGNVVVVVANIGTERVEALKEISIIDTSDGSSEAGSWYYLNGTALTGNIIPVSGAAKWQSTGTCSGTCTYRVTGGSGRTQRVSVTC